MKVQELLFSLRDEKYAKFQLNLTPGMTEDQIIGVRMPALRQFAKEYAKDPEAELFMKSLPHFYYDENMLHGVLISGIKEYERCIAALEMFLPYMDNWAVCDTTSPKIFRKHRKELMQKIHEWCASSHTYICRFGIGMLMEHFLDEDFLPEYLEIPASVISEEYYINMMIAWYYATALAKQWDAAIPYLEKNRLGIWVHNKTIQKAVESYRITDEQKIYLKTLRRKK